MSDEHNPYVVEGEASTLRNSVVAFIDMLGYQGIIRRAAGHLNSADAKRRTAEFRH